MRALFMASLLALFGAEAFASRQPTLLRRAALGAAPTAAEGGVSVSAISPNSAAARARLAVGDIVTHIGDHTVASPRDFRVSVAASPSVNDARPGNAQLVLLPGMDHFLAHAATQAESFQREHSGNAFGEYYADFSTTIGVWICARARCSA